MKTFINIVRARKGFLVECLEGSERKHTLRSLVNITLNYKIKGNIGMYNHVMKGY